MIHRVTMMRLMCPGGNEIGAFVKNTLQVHSEKIGVVANENLDGNQMNTENRKLNSKF